jgi:hypothetical protein
LKRLPIFYHLTKISTLYQERSNFNLLDQKERRLPTNSIAQMPEVGQVSDPVRYRYNNSLLTKQVRRRHF